jgi:hypothetical protein
MGIAIGNGVIDEPTQVRTHCNVHDIWISLYQHTQNVPMTSPYSHGSWSRHYSRSFCVLAYDDPHRTFIPTFTFVIFLPHYLTLPSPSPSSPPSPVPYLHLLPFLHLHLFPYPTILLFAGSHVRRVRLHPRFDPPRSKAEGREIPPEVQSEGAKLYEEYMT